MFRGSVFLFLVLFVHNSSCVINDLYNAGEEMWNLYLILDKISLNDNSIAELVLKGNDSENQVIKIQIDKIFKNLDQIEKSMNSKKIIDLLKVSKSDMILHSSLTGLELSIENIDENYEKFHEYMNKEYDHSDDSPGRFIRNLVLTVEGDIAWIRKLIDGDNPGLPNRSNVVKAIAERSITSGPYKFQYLNSTELGAFGTNFTCPEDNGYPIEDGTGWNVYRGVCACDCYGNDNKISLSLMESRVRENWVITGIRVVGKNGILHIQPKEGKLKANGQISRYTGRWIVIPKNPKVQRIDRKNKVFFLDDLHLPAFHVLTGVKFNKVRRGNTTGFAIEIFGIPFDRETGVRNSKNISHIFVKASNIRSVPNLPFKRVSPIHVSMPQIPDSEEIGYVTLERSELSADFRQSTLPFFDTVPIVTTSSSIFGGIGLFHKGTADHAGIISLRVFGIQYNKDLSEFQLHHMPNGKVSFNNSNNHAN